MQQLYRLQTRLKAPMCRQCWTSSPIIPSMWSFALRRHLMDRSLGPLSLVATIVAPPPSSYPDALISSFALPMQSIAVQVSTMANSRRTIIVMPTFNDCTGKLCHSRHSVVQVDHPVGDAPHTGVVNCSACSGDHICIHKAAVTFKLVEALDERGIDPGTDLTSDCIFSVDLTPNRHQLVYLTRGEASGVICGPVLLRLFPRPRIYLLTTHAPN